MNSVRLSAAALIIAACFLTQANAAAPSAGPGGSSPGSGPSAPATPLPAGFEAFYVVANGTDPNFQSYVTEMTARYLQMLHGWANPSDPNPYLWMVSAPGWNQDTLSNTCKTDPNTVGGIVITFSAFYTDAYWILWNAETMHVTPSIAYISCVKGTPQVVTPTINLHTEKSKGVWTVPFAPLAGVAALFVPTGSTQTQTVSTTGGKKHTTMVTTTSTTPHDNWGVVVPLTIASSFSGNVGVFNPGSEALSAARVVSIDAAVVTRNLCAIPTPSANIQLSTQQTMADALKDAQHAIDPNGDADIATNGNTQTGTARTDLRPGSYRELMYPSLMEVGALMQLERNSYLNLPSIVAAPSPSPSPAMQMTVSASSDVVVAAMVKSRPTRRHAEPPSTASAPIALPLATMCKALGGKVDTTSLPRPTSR